MEQLANVFETIMVICFGLSWPLSIIRSIRSKSTKGKSVSFMMFIVVGYLCGVVSKCMTQTFNLAFYFYFLNILMVTIDILLYFRHKRQENSVNATSN